MSQSHPEDQEAEEQLAEIMAADPTNGATDQTDQTGGATGTDAAGGTGDSVDVGDGGVKTSTELFRELVTRRRNLPEHP